MQNFGKAAKETYDMLQTAFRNETLLFENISVLCRLKYDRIFVEGYAPTRLSRVHINVGGISAHVYGQILVTEDGPRGLLSSGM
jgi:hypothetical protein